MLQWCARWDLHPQFPVRTAVLKTAAYANSATSALLNPEVTGAERLPFFWWSANPKLAIF
jgi:hypothetical protein